MNSLLVLALILAAPFAFAGTSDGGGGVGVRCANKLELLDRYEAEKTGLHILHQPNSQQEASDLIGSLLGRQFANGLTNNYLETYTSIISRYSARPIFVSEQEETEGYIYGFGPVSVIARFQTKFVSHLPLSEDLGDYKVDPGCALEQIAYFDDSTMTLKIARAPWRELSLLDKAMLIAHELIYWDSRRIGLEDLSDESTPVTSKRAREFVGRLFSSYGVKPKYSELWSLNSSHVVCNSLPSQNPSRTIADTFFEAFDNAHNGMTLVVNSIGGFSTPYRSDVVFSNLKVADLFDGGAVSFASRKLLRIDDEINPPKFSVSLSKTQREGVKIELSRISRNSQSVIASLSHLHCYLVP